MSEMDLFSEAAEIRFAKLKEENKHCYVDRKMNRIMIKTGVGGGSYEYDIDLKRCATASQCLDWIHQVNVKTWATPEIMKDFISILFRNIKMSLWSGA